MDHKKIRAVGAAVLVMLWTALTVFSWFGKTKELSTSERRPLKQMPLLSMDTILDGSFMEDFEGFTLDQFPLRDSFRQIKALFHNYGLNQSDNNDLYLADGYLAKQEYPLDTDSVDHAVDRFNFVYEKHLKDKASNIYVSVVPDKNYYLGEASGHLTLDYTAMFDSVKLGMPWASYIDITDSLSVEDYYRTDTHWRQENLLPVAQKLLQAMGAAVPEAEDFTTTELDQPFYGVYYGQAALPVDPDTIRFLHSEAIDQYILYDCNEGTPVQKDLYDMTQLESMDLYDVYLTGAKKGTMVIENPNGTPGKELVIFRDSYGSSIAPLLVSDYAKVTLIDIRQYHPAFPNPFLQCEGKDVLFLYSALVLNDSQELK